MGKPAKAEMKAHSRAKHHLGHRAVSMEFRGKRDSVYITCECGFVDCIGNWYDKPPRGWDKEQWPRLIEGIQMFLDSWFPNDEPMRFVKK